MDLEELFAGYKGSSYGAKYNFIGSLPENTKLAIRHRYEVQCKDCEYIFMACPNRVFSGVISCKCSKSFRKPKEDFDTFVKEKLDQKGFVLISLSYVRPLTESVVRFSCKICGAEAQKKFDSVAYNSTGCPTCNNKYRPTDQEYVEILESKLNPKSISLKDYPKSEKLTRNSIITTECLKCKRVSNKTISSVIHHDSNCPCSVVWGFDPSVENYLYLINLKIENKIYYKIGITNNIFRRMNEFKNNNNAEVEVMMTWYYPNNSIIEKHEQYLKDNFCIGGIKDKPFESGYTEVINEEYFNTVLIIQNLQYREVSCGF